MPLTRVQGLIHYVPIFKEYVREFLLSSVEDGISYVEPRILFYFKCVLSHEMPPHAPVIDRM